VDLSLEEAFEKVRTHVVQLTVQRSDEGPDFNAITVTGFLIDARQGLIVTPAAALCSARRVVTRFPGGDVVRPRRASLLGVDEKSAIGVLSVGPVEPVPPPLENSTACSGQVVLAVSTTPEAREEGSDGVLPTSSVGVLAGKRESYQWRGFAFEEILELVVEEPETSPGSIIALPSGELIGVLLSPRAARDAEGGQVGFAVPMGAVLAGVRRVLDGVDGEFPAPEQARPWVGISCGDLEDSLLRAHLRIPGGVVIYDVLAESPAERAGLQPFDIIVGWNLESVVARDGFFELLRTARPGDRVELELYRQGVRQSTELTLGSW
jgi:serine protease Do